MFPRLIHIYGPLWIQSYGVMIAIGFLAFLYCTYRHPLRKRLVSGEVYLNAVFLGLIAGIFGGRILFVLTDFREFASNWVDMFYPWIGGFSVLGSIIAVLVTVPLYLKKHIKQEGQVLVIFDLAGVYGPLMQSIARIGCFLAGCCYGVPVGGHVWWAVTFTDSVGSAPLCIALHPAQIYSSLFLLGIFIVMRVLVANFMFRPGQLLFLYLILESIERFSVDFFRGDRGALTYLLSQVQMISIMLFAFALLGFLWVTLIQRKPAQYLR
ncbi:MAG: prolipoprotein diacylglyceryl transferase family protein [bacterium]